ncbi:histidine kinase [Blastococcus sp. TBT05-19]|uniref:histidine kinase n=1 Tax=Blastococcus sp. TBT05-19 TaxID=2250581 RepID=UPI000DEA682E|nr:histidine kinase [Blastococcus sp. TBT05-19]RBY92403.1 histidine kinase [Blastococcus sp. TBT05-19]
MVPARVADVAPWQDWTSAADDALRFLHHHVGWDLWMVTRLVGDRQVVLRAWPDRDVRPGASVPWADSLCRQMVEGNAPRMATVTAIVPAYAAHAQQPVGTVAAYVGIPLLTRDLELFGTLCGVSARAKPRSAARELTVIEAAARTLSSLMAAGMEPPPVPPRPESSN